ncbi:MAG TPA: YggT family protein [Phototrophicaceae bacterium]|nr:YggT family protein [Phototrophicaceae bacterium]
MIIIYYILVLFELIVLARVLLSWFPTVDRYNPIVKFIFDVTEPVLRPIRERLPQTGTIDFSPLIVFLIINVLISLLFH